MTENYFENLGFQNNLKVVQPGKTSLMSNNTVTTNFSQDGSKAFTNTNESLGIEELPPMEEDIDHLKNFHLQNRNNIYHFNNLGVTNKYSQYTTNMSHSFQNKTNLNNPFMNTFQPQRNTQSLLFNNLNDLNNPLYTNKRNSSGEKIKPMKVQSRYSSSSENKYHFMNRFTNNPLFKFQNNFNTISGNVPKINYAPVNNIKSYTNNNILNNNNSNNKYYYNNNNIESLYSNTSQSPFSTPSTPAQNVINSNNNIQNKQFSERENNYKQTSNYGLKTVDAKLLQNNIQSIKIKDSNNKSERVQNKNMNINNKIISNFDITGNNTNISNYYQAKNPIPINQANINNNNYMNVNRLTVSPNDNNKLKNNINIGTQRLTNYETNNNYQNIFYNASNNNQPITQANNQLNFNQVIKNVQVPKKTPEIAVVTKITDDNDDIFNLINNNVTTKGQNIEGFDDTNLNNQIFNKTAELPKNQNININFIQNNINNINIKNSKQISNKPQPKLINNTKNNNYISEDINKLLNQNINQYSSQTPQKNPFNPTINKPLYPQPQNQTQNLKSNYNTGTNTVITSRNFNPKNINIYQQNQTQNQTQNKNNNFNEFYQPSSERLTITNEKNSTPINPIKNKDIEVTYSDFDGSGYVKNYGGVSRPGKDSSGEQKTNQDALVCKTNINNIKDFNIFGVLDGHGPDGHYVSQFAAEFIPSNIVNHPEIKSLKDTEQIYKKLKENNCSIITQAFIMADQNLKNVQFDVFESGSTCCLIIHIGTHIICANSGDSRALVVFDNPGNTNINNLIYWSTVPLSTDFKPELPEERNRILMSGGEVEQMKNDYGEGCGPYRVWVKGKDYPGLAMSRSIGDLKGKEIGVIPNPGILEYDLNKSTRYVIACSDGVFEFLENKTVMELGKKFYLKNNASDYCHELVKEALKEWENNDNIVDDITAVVAFF